MVGTRPEKIRIQKWYTVYKDHITLSDYEISEVGKFGLLDVDTINLRTTHKNCITQQGANLELYYN